MNWLSEFTQSDQMKRIVVANYLDHVRDKHGIHKKYSTIEEALSDFAERTGLTEMQKRALRREVLRKVAMDDMVLREKNDRLDIEFGEAPASVLPGVKPGSEKEKAIKQKLRKKQQHQKEPGIPDAQVGSYLNEDLGGGTNIHHTGYGEDNAVHNEIHSLSSFKPGLVIQAEGDEEEGGLFGDLVVEPEEQKPEIRLKQDKKKYKSKGTPISPKERNLLKKLKHLEDQLQQLKTPESSLKKPIVKDPDNWKLMEDTLSAIVQIRAELGPIVMKRERKKQLTKPVMQAQRNAREFATLVDSTLGLAHTSIREKYDERNKKLRELSDEGLQKVFDTASDEFRKHLYYKPSQGYDKEIGDYVKCLVCDKEGKTWIYNKNPTILPFFHLETHADELLGDVDLLDPRSMGYHREIVNAYLKKYPGAALEAREQELARFFEGLIEQARGRSLINPPHVVTDQEKKIDYTDDVLKESILYQLQRGGVDPKDKSTNELADELLQEIKEHLSDIFPRYSEDTPVGKLEKKDIPFLDFQQIFDEHVNQAVNEYRGTAFSPRRTRRRKVRHTAPSREQIRKRTERQMEWEDAERELRRVKHTQPSKKEIREYLKEKKMIPITIGVEGRGCWNCGYNQAVWTHRGKINIDSVTCPNCGVYREKYVGRASGRGLTASNHLLSRGARKEEEGLLWECPICKDHPGYEGKILVIRDPNKTPEEPMRNYQIYCDDDRMGNGPLARGYSKCVFRVGSEEQFTRTRIDVDKETGEIIGTLNEGERVHCEEYGNGTVILVEKMPQGSYVWVDFDHEPKRLVKLKDLVGEVIKHGNKYYKVDEIRTEEGTSAETEDEAPKREELKVNVIMNEIGGGQKRVIRHYGTGDLEATAEALHCMPVAELTKLSELLNKRYRRAWLIQRLCTAKCSYSEPFFVERKVSEPEETGGSSKFRIGTHLERRVVRARLIRSIMERLNG